MNTRKPLQDLSGVTMADRYLLERCIGRGGFASVYRAQDRRLGSTVAVKILHPEHTRNVKDVDRFFNEAKIAGRINDERLVKVTDYFQDGERCGFVMEHLEGATLRDELVRQEGEVMWWPRAFKIAREVCLALDAAHSYEIVHRDIKPENIFMMRVKNGPERIRLLDLGVAKVLQSWSGVRQGLSNARDIIGSPFYMAPEQVEGTIACDGRADIYSLGVVMYEMVTGVVPFRGSNDFETMYHQVKSEPTPPRVLRPTLKLPRAFEGIIMCALAKQPDQRFRSVKEMEKAIAFELARSTTSQRIPNIAQMMPAVADDVSGSWQPAQPAVDSLIARTRNIVMPAASAVKIAGRVSDEMTTQKRVTDPNLAPAGVMRTLVKKEPPAPVGDSRIENDLTPSPKRVDRRPAKDTEVTSPDVDAATSEPKLAVVRTNSQLPLHPRSFLMLGSLVVASLVATCSVSSVLAMVIDARPNGRSTVEGRGQVVVVEEEPEPSTVRARVESQPVRVEAPLVQPATDSTAKRGEAESAATVTAAEGQADVGTDAAELPEVAPQPAADPGASRVKAAAKKPARVGKPTVTRGPEEASVLMPVTQTMRSIAGRAAATIRNNCKISKHSPDASAEVRVVFNIKSATAEVVSVQMVGEAPVMAKQECVAAEAKRMVPFFFGASDLAGTYEHAYRVNRD